MRWRLNQNDVTNTVNVEDADAVKAELRRISEDLLAKPPAFYQSPAKKRLDGSFDSVYRYAESHFAGGNLYCEAIDRNMSHLQQALAEQDLSLLRRQSVSLSQAPPPPNKPCSTQAARRTTIRQRNPASALSSSR